MYFILSRKSLKKIIVLICFAVSLCIFSVYAGNRNKQLCIVVDAGHGLPDGGAVGIGGSVEQEINLSIAQKLSEVLNAKGIKVIMTRTDSEGLWTKKSNSIREKKVEDMHERLRIMKKSNADLFITIHMNSHKSSSASGLRIFYSDKFSEIKPLAEQIQLRMSDITGASMSVVKTADKNLFLLKNPPIPSILVECGFLSNPEEEKKLCSDDYRARLAWAVADAVEKYYSSLQSTPG